MFGTAAMTPGFANIRQKGTFPSAKSNQYGALPGSVHSCRSDGGVVGTGSAVASVPPASSAVTSAVRTPSLRTGDNSSRGAGRTRPRFTDCLRLGVERRIDFRHFLRLAGVVGGSRVGTGLPTEGDVERTDPITAVRVDLLQRRE